MNFFRVSLIAIILSFASAMPARAAGVCVIDENLETLFDVSANFIWNMAEVSYWILDHLVVDHMFPAFAQMAEQWTTSDMKAIEDMRQYYDDEQQHQAMIMVTDLKSKFVSDLHPSEGLCERITQNVGVVTTRFEAQNAEKSLLNTFTSSAVSSNGSPAGNGALNYSLARYEHYLQNSCTEDDMMGALDGICTLADPEYVDADIDPDFHFSALTVESNDPEGATNAMHVNAFSENICGGKVLSMLSGDYFGNGKGVNALKDASRYWQFAAFCRSSAASYAAFKAPGNRAFSDEQRETLIASGYQDAAEIDEHYGDNPSLDAYTDMIISTYNSPKKMAVDQIEKEEVLLAYDAMGIATELMLLDKYKDIHAQETRNLSLYLALKLDKQRDVANATIISVSKDGGKGL